MKYWSKIIERRMTIETCTWKGIFSSHVEWMNLYAFLPSSVHAKSLHSCLILWDPMDCGPLGSSVHGIPLDCIAIPSSRVSSQSRNWTHVTWVSYTGVQIVYHYTTWKAPKSYYNKLEKSCHQQSTYSCVNPTGGTCIHAALMVETKQPLVESSDLGDKQRGIPTL